ncbi:MAG TPA: DUF1467 family protein [Acetobacteraceae bacterium]|nr:DUF1467 family protein [Acetobacteraceae bacterium]
MGWFTGLVVYLLIWWTVLFAVLPIGVHSTTNPDPHTGWRGAPENPRMLTKIVITSVVAAILWVGVDLLISSDYMSFRHGMFAAPRD